MHAGDWDVNHLWFGLLHDAVFIIPCRAFKVESVEIATVSWGLALDHCLIGKFHNLVLELNFVNRELILSCKVLFDSSQERLREKEA